MSDDRRAAEAAHIKGLWRAEEQAKRDREAQLEGIVRDLAATDPIRWDVEQQALMCKHCDAWHKKPHRADCVWAQASEFVANHPTGEPS